MVAKWEYVKWELKKNGNILLIWSDIEMLFCFSLHEVAIPLAKLIPYVCGLFKRLGCDAPNPLVQVSLQPNNCLDAIS